MNQKTFLSSEFDQYPPEYAKFHVIPVPYEGTVSYGGGTASGPQAILDASDQLEVFDGTSSPGEEGIHTHRLIDCDGESHEVFQRITDTVTSALNAGKERPGVPVILGGEHSITAPAVSALRDFLGHGTPLGLIQIDAHADLRDAYEGRKDSHACVARRVHEDLGVPVVQIGVRAISPEEVLYRGHHGSGSSQSIWAYDASSIVPAGTMEILIPPGFPKHVYLTIDVDGLDSSIMPATGTPVPGGLGWYQVLAIIESIARQVHIAAFDVVELAPIPGMHGWNYTAAELTYRVMGIISRH